jgi:hypothetical protein
MVTNIKEFHNQSDRDAIAFNTEKVGNSFWLRSLDRVQGDLWISFHKDRPLLMSTKKGLCKVWDRDWKVWGEWQGGPEFKFLEGGPQGVGGEISVTIDGNGDITMGKR